jgi:hypothetical protein
MLLALHGDWGHAAPARGAGAPAGTAGVDAEVVLFYGEGELLEDLRATPVPVHVLGKRHRYDVLGFATQLTRHVRQSRPDAVYAWLPAPSMVASVIAALARRPKVVWGLRQAAASLSHYDRALRWSFTASGALARTSSSATAKWGGTTTWRRATP